MTDFLRSFCFVKTKVAAPQVALGLVLIMLQCVIVKFVAQISLTRFLRADHFGGTRLASCVPSST